jgi:hypothetical protein
MIGNAAMQTKRNGGKYYEETDCCVLVAAADDGILHGRRAEYGRDSD